MNGQSMNGMACPVCKTGLAIAERQGIEIDYCPSCRGVWLDRNELDKIVERSAAAAPPRAAGAQQGRGYEHTHDDRYHHGRPKRRKSFLEELFD